MKACLDKVGAHPAFSQFDQKAMGSYKKYLVNNKVQLKPAPWKTRCPTTLPLGSSYRNENYWIFYFRYTLMDGGFHPY